TACPPTDCFAQLQLVLPLAAEGREVLPRLSVDAPTPVLRVEEFVPVSFFQALGGLARPLRKLFRLDPESAARFSNKRDTSTRAHRVCGYPRCGWPRPLT